MNTFSDDSIAATIIETPVSLSPVRSIHGVTRFQRCLTRDKFSVNEPLVGSDRRAIRGCRTIISITKGQVPMYVSTTCHVSRQSCISSQNGSRRVFFCPSCVVDVVSVRPANDSHRGASFKAPLFIPLSRTPPPRPTPFLYPDKERTVSFRELRLFLRKNILGTFSLFLLVIPADRYRFYRERTLRANFRVTDGVTEHSRLAWSL